MRRDISGARGGGLGAVGKRESAELAQARPEQHKVLQKADEQGTCLDLEVNGMRAQDLVVVVARLLIPQQHSSELSEIF